MEDEKIFSSADKLKEKKDNIILSPHSQKPKSVSDSHPLKKQLMSGKMIEPLEMKGNENVSDFIKNVFGNSGYNARKLAEACNTFHHMINDNATVCVTLAGAMTPIGMSGPVIELIKNGFLDMIISTGANIYHDLHRAYDFPVVQGSEHVDDNLMEKLDISRIYDVFISEGETMYATDWAIVKAGVKPSKEITLSTADLHYAIGKEVLRTAQHPEKSFLAMAAKYNVPVYTSSPGDSSVAMNLMIPHFFHREIKLDIFKDIIEIAAIAYKSNKNGVVIVGGGSPKNFYLQAQPTLWQMLDLNKGGHDYFVQLTTDAPHWGGLSGATPSEAKSWGKVKDAFKNNVVVYSCASLTFPMLVQYVLANNQPREQRNLMHKKNDMAVEVLKLAKDRPKMRIDYGDILSFEDVFKRLYEKTDS